MIPFVDLTTQYQNLKPEILLKLQRIMETCDFILGREVDLFEKEFAEFCGVPHGIGVGSGLDALKLTLKAYGIGKGDEVITAANTYIATVLAISETGANPVLVDVEPETYNINIKLIKKALSPKTKAVIPVHLYGQPADMDSLYDQLKNKNIKIIEDSCQAHGARFKGRKTGSLGDAGCFSFYPGKNLGCYGDGGMVVTADRELAEKIKKLRNYGQSRKYYHDLKGCNSRLDTIQAGILRIKMKYLDLWNKKRRLIAHSYREKIDQKKIILPEEMARAYHVYHLFVIRHPDRDSLLNALKKADINTGIHYPVPVHLQKCYRDLGYKKESFPVAESLAGEILSLPIFPEMKDCQIESVAKIINDF